ncbi:MAG: gliding motility-associated C-terminal domain-containing protein [Ferruginibacter sp.]
MQLTIRKNNSFQLLLKSAQKQWILLFLFIAGFSMNSFAQPVNDDPCNAIPIIPDAVCSFQTYDNTGATASAGVPAPGCANYQGGDVWFQIVVPAASNGNLTFNNQLAGIQDLGMAVYSGTCDNLTLVACDDDSGPGLASQIILQNQVVGTTLWIRVWEYGGDTYGTFGFCIKYPGPPPAYDDPCNAIPLPTPTTTCNYQTFTDDGATSSANVPAPGCANYTGGDVWFQVVVPAGGVLTFDTNTGEVTDGGMAIYSGATCDNLTLIACDDDASPNGLMPMIQANNLVPGSTIWIRFWSKGLANNVGSFQICVMIPPPPPANDDPCNAIPLTAEATCNFQTFTTVSAFPTPGAPAPGCANYTGGDVWFQVVVPPGGAIVVNTQTGVITDGGMAIYRGTCDNMQLIACDDNSSSNGNMPQIIATSLNPGTTVWIRFWENGNDNPGTFGICVTIPPPPPVNDEPCNAIPLTATSTCNYQTFTTESATSSAGAPAPGCANYVGGDVWFTVTVPCDGNLQFDTQTGVITDGGMAIYRGTCDNLQLIACDDNSSANGLMPLIIANSLTPGSTVWVRVWEYGNDNPGTFGICVSIPPPPPPTGTCNGAQPFCSSNTYTYPASQNVPSLGGQGIYGCLYTTPNPAWYYLQIANPGPMSIHIVQTAVGGTNLLDVDYCLWGPFSSVAASCGNLAASNIVSCSYSIAGDETATIPNGQAGEFYILLITNYSNQQGSVTFNQNGGTGSTSCDILCTLTSGNSGPVCACGTVDLTSSLVVDATYQWTGPNCVNQLPGSNQQNLSNVPVPCTPGMYIYNVTATTPSGTSCFSADTVYVVLAPKMGNDTTVNICNGTTRDLYSIWDTTGLTTAWTEYPGGAVVATPEAVAVAGDYQLIVSNAGGCYDTVIATLTVAPRPSLGNDTPINICGGTTFDLTTLYTAVTTGLTTAWTFGGSPVADPTSVSVAGVYQLIATNSSDCSDTALVILVVDPKPALGNDTAVTICSGTSLDLNTLYTSTTTGLTTAWTTSPGGVPVTAPVNTAGVYQLIATSAAGCKDTALATITLDVVTGIATATGAANCTVPGTITVTSPVGVGTFEYSISTNPGVYQSSNVFNESIGDYTIIVRDGLGCTSAPIPVTVSGTDNLTFNPAPVTSTICLGKSVTLDANSNATTFVWTPATGLDDATIGSPVATPNVTTVYSVTATLGSCVRTGTVTINIFNDLSVDAGGPLTIDAGGSQQAGATVSGSNTTLASILWSPSAGLSATNILNPVVTPVITSGTTTYAILVTNTNGCIATDTLTVNVEPVSVGCINARNAFTPNGDGVNDTWNVYDSYSCLANVTVSVFNRYGSKVFESTDYRNNWYGKYKGKELPDGTYYAIIEYKLLSGKTKTVKIDVTLLR